MPTAAFTTLGCKVNQYETQRILDSFEERGFTITEFNAPADIYFINTCSVTQAAERKSRQMVRKAARQNPNAIVVMTGCYAEMSEMKQEIVEEATLIVPNHLKMETLDYLLDARPELKSSLDRPVQSPPSQTYRRRTRATVKVQDGCDVFCTFCSIPYTRKIMRSRPIEEVISEAEALAENGYKELVITGVLVGAYGQARGEGWSEKRDYLRPDLSDLLLRLAQVEGIQRVRLSSIEPTQVTDRLLDAFSVEPRLCPHLHIPLQSGDSGILRAMNRPYEQEFYLERCFTALERIPDLAITSDIMVGFPGEDQSAFEQTLSVVQKVGFARAHIFRYSSRPNTPAALLPDHVSEEEKEARSHELANLCRRTQQSFINHSLGKVMEVLVEGRMKNNLPGQQEGAGGNDGHISVAIQANVDPEILLSGYTGNYIRVQFTGGSHLIGSLTPVKLLEPCTDGAIGEAGGAHFTDQEAPPDADFIPLATLAAIL